MMTEPYLSLCIPTNGITEWVIPVLESIYSQNCDNDEFEVIVTDNGSNSDFKAIMREYAKKYNNFLYCETSAVMFLNQIEAFKLANGMLIKFINHRMALIPNALDYLIKFAKDNSGEQPVTYFSNGALKLSPMSTICNGFDGYVKTLENFSSWSAGTAIWKSEFEKLDLCKGFNPLFPHTNIIFSNKTADKYIVDDTILTAAVLSDDTKKGKYNLFDAFAVQYMDIIYKLYDEGSITYDTYEYVRKKNGYAISEWYWAYVIRRVPCSYDLSGYKAAIGKYYTDTDIKLKILEILLRSLGGKLKKYLSLV